VCPDSVQVKKLPPQTNAREGVIYIEAVGQTIKVKVTIIQKAATLLAGHLPTESYVITQIPKPKYPNRVL
jgi:hypothetical protein